MKRAALRPLASAALGVTLALACAAGAVGEARAQGKKPQTEAPKPAATQDLIGKGRALFEDQQYEESIQALSAALLRPNNSAAERVEIYRLLALDYITLGRTEEADNAVRGLLAAQPDYELPAGESPRFREFFAKAKEKWIAEGRPGFVVETPVDKPVALRHGTPSQAEAGKTIALRGTLDDPDERVETVKLHFRAGSQGAFTEATADIGEDASVRVNIPGSAVKPPLMDYYFELQDAAGKTLATRGDEQNPLRIAIPDKSRGWVLPVAIGGGVLGAAAVVGALALAGVFSSEGPTRPGTSNVSISVHDAAFFPR